MVIQEIGRVAQMYVIVELDIRAPDKARYRFPPEDLPMKDSLFFGEIQEIFGSARLEIVDRINLKSKGTGQAILVLKKVKDFR